MNDLQLFKAQNIATLDSRDVAVMVGKDHPHLLRDIKTYIEYIEEIGESNNGFTEGALKIEVSDFFIESTYVSEQNKTLPCYLITRKGCELIANKLTGAKGVKFTAIYIERFHAMEERLHIPKTLSEALRLAADLAERNEQLQTKVEAQVPKVLFADSVSASRTSILVGELAKILKQNGVDTGQNRLFEWMRDNGYLISRKGTDYNMPTQYSMELGLFEIKETTVTHADGHISVSKTPKVTGKGQIYFVNKLLESIA